MGDQKAGSLLLIVNILTIIFLWTSSFFLFLFHFFPSVNDNNYLLELIVMNSKINKKKVCEK